MNRSAAEMLADIRNLAGEIAAGGASDWRAASIVKLVAELEQRDASGRLAKLLAALDDMQRMPGDWLPGVKQRRLDAARKAARSAV